MPRVMRTLTVMMAQGLHSIPGSLLNVNTFERFKAAQEQASQHLQKVRSLWDLHRKIQHALGHQGNTHTCDCSSCDPLAEAPDTLLLVY